MPKTRAIPRLVSAPLNPLLPNVLAGLLASTLGGNPFDQNFRKFRSKTQWIGSAQPEKFGKNWSIF